MHICIKTLPQKQLFVGQPVWCCVTSPPQGRTVTLSLNPDSVKQFVTPEAAFPTINAATVGSLVNAKVEKIAHNGLIMSFAGLQVCLFF